jgi:RNA polymerase sigma-70 factor (ECF subfamily)
VALKDPTNKEAWERFAFQYAGRVQRWSYRCCRGWHLPEHDARDVAGDVRQHILLTIHEKLRSYDLNKREEGGFRRWLRTATHNALIDLLRRRERDRGSGDTEVLERLNQEPARAELDRELEELFEREAFQQALARVRSAVSERDWQVCQALGWEDGRARKSPGGEAPPESVAGEVARRYGMTVLAVVKVKSRVLKKLREEMRRLLDEVDRE